MSDELQFLPQRVNVFSGIGDVVLVDADALLCYLWSEEHCVDWTYGGQLLHLAEAAERFLQQWIRRHARVHLVFFECGNWLWRADPSKLLARRVLALHLRQSITDGFDVHLGIKSWSMGEWAHLVHTIDPNCIVSVDHTRITLPEHQRYFKEHSRHHSSVHQRDVVLLPQVEYRGNDIRAWMLPRRAGLAPKTEGEALPASSSEWDTLVSLPTPTGTTEDTLTRVKAALASLKGLDPRVLFALEESFKLCQAIPITSRFVTFGRGDGPSGDLLAAITLFCEALYPFATHDMIDVLDGRLAHHLYLKGSGTTRTKREQPQAGAAAVKQAEPRQDAAPAQGNAVFAAAVVATATAVSAATVDTALVVESAPLAESWDAVADWDSFDTSSIVVVQGDAPITSAATAQVIAPTLSAVDAVTPVASEKSSAPVDVPRGDDRNDIVLGEPKKKIVVRTKQERKGEQRAAHLEKLQADSLLGRYVQNHVITLDHKASKQDKVKSKVAKLKAAALAQEQAQQEKLWKDWLVKHKNTETKAALAFVADNEWEEDFEHLIMVELSEHAPALHDAMSIVAELAFRGSPHTDRLAAVASKWGFDLLSRQLRGDHSTVDPKWIRHQLLETSDLLPREQGAADPRVKHFRPDAWQKKLLDHVDEKKSCIVVAPTSAGKTFIQYYVMEKVLRHDDNGVVVYVCPTKPLCNQVVAGVNARYKKEYPGSSTVLCGLFLTDRRHRADSCQILVTVPECLDVLLLSPTKVGQAWVKRLEWIIFDEVHTINNPAEGPVWERILQLTTCPFLALSATVGHPERFQAWLSETRKQRVELIVHQERYNDLRTFVSTVVPSGGVALSLVHPCTFVEVPELVKGGFPTLADFEARDSLALWEVMAQHDAAGMADLSPDRIFQQPVISRQMAKRWAGQLKERLVAWARKDAALVERVIAPLRARVESGAVWLSMDEQDGQEALFEITQQHLVDGPVLLFCDARSQTEEMVEFYANKLAEMQAAKAPDEKKQKLLDKEREKMQKLKNRTQKQSKNKKEQEERERAGETNEVMVLPMEEQYPLEFTLRRKDRGGLGKEDREEIITSLRRKTRWPDSHPLVQGLRRGVGCHHEGLPHRYRVAVELMFRTGDITVVFATQTLAQGIHAPARTVVLVGDSPTFLTPTSLRQMSGRAGRRGYDLLGQVTFFGVSYGRIRQLMNSRIPELRGGFPLSASLTLRLLSWHSSAAAAKEMIEEHVQQLLAQPLLSRNCEKTEIPHLLTRFYEYYGALWHQLGALRSVNGKAGDRESKLVWLGGLAAHMSYMDPSNAFFIHLVGQGAFDAFAKDLDPAQPASMEALLIRLACALCPVEVHPELALKFRDTQSTLGTSGVVERVPDDIQTQARAYNALVLKLFRESLLKTITEPQKAELPLSRKAVGGADVSLAHQADLEDCIASPVSVFALTSGVSMDTHWTDLNRVVHTARTDLCLEHCSLPVVPQLTTYNSFVLDFFRRLVLKNADDIRRDNYLHEAWYLLHDFQQSLRLIAMGFSKMHSHHDNVLDANLYRMLAEDTDPIPTSTESQTDPASVKREKRLGNAMIVLSHEFDVKFSKLVN